MDSNITADQYALYIPKVSLVWSTPNGDSLIAEMARVSILDNKNKPIEKLIKYLADHKHNSPFEMVNMCIELFAPRDITRQVIRHRSFSFQEFCIAGDSLISVRGLNSSSRKQRISIADLYARQQSGDYNGRRKGLLARVYDESSKLLVYAPIREVFHTGVKPVYRVSVGNGTQKVLTSTAEHKFLCRDGVFRPLHNIAVGDFVALNGIPVYQSPEWMADAKTRSMEKGIGLAYIAEEAGCSTHTIRKWLRKHGMQFTHAEIRSYTPVWNKGLPPEQQPRFDKLHSEETRTKMRESARHGEDSNLFKHGNSRSWRQTVQDHCDKWKLSLVRQQNNACNHCGVEVSVGCGSEIDHKKPVAFYPELAFELENLQVLCKECHEDKSSEEVRSIHHTIRWGRVNSIVSAGTVDTYDLEVDHTSHNYVANGIVVHNSGRYAEYPDSSFVLREPRLQHESNRQMSVEMPLNTEKDKTRYKQLMEIQVVVINAARDCYYEMLHEGIAKEQARSVLPEGNTLSRMYINGNLRSWVHYLQIRTDISTVQKEHAQVAKAIQVVFKQEFPTVHRAFFGE